MLRTSLFTLLSVSLFVLALATSCGQPKEPASTSQAEVPVEDLLARERVAAYFNAGEPRLAEARKALAPLVTREDAQLDDLVHAAAIELGAGDYEAAQTWLARAAELAPRDPRIAYMRGRLLNNDGASPEETRAQFELALAGAPDDLPTKLCLAQALRDLEQFDQAEALLRSIVEGGIEQGGSWYTAAIYRLMRHYLELEQPDESRRYSDLWTQLEAQGFKPPGETQFDRGNLGGVPPPTPNGSKVSGEKRLPAFALRDAILPQLGRATGFSLHDVNGDRLLDVIAWGPDGVSVATQGYDAWSTTTVHAGAADFALAFDMDNDLADDLDLLVVAGDSLALYECRGESDPKEWTLREGVLPASPGRVAAVVPLDADHEGDLDLLLLGPFGARLWRNDGMAQPGGVFTDASGEASLPRDVALTWGVSEDFDSDQDVDFLLGGPGGTFLMSNLRGGHFEERAALELGQGTRFDSAPVVADLDGDARPDLLVRAAGGQAATIWTRRAKGGYAQAPVELALPAQGEVLQTDIDLDGSLDLVWVTSAGRCAGALSIATPAQKPFELADAKFGQLFDARDIDRDGDVDLIYLDADGLHVLAANGEGLHASGLEWIGKKDNKRAIGAIIEVRVGSLYRRLYWRGDSQLVGLGNSRLIDVVRVTWPNGVVQTELDIEEGYLPVDSGARGPFEQAEGLMGSCPFLYTWNGSEYEFISDVLGITPLGLPMAPGMLVPPDHDEFVLVRGDQLQPRDGLLTMQFTEELREVTYLDRIRLDVVDHPAGSEIFPDERFCFPPFPAAHTHTVVAPLAPTRATGSDGQDWTASLAEVDDVHAIPFEPLHGQFLGLATPHFLELEFDPARVAGATKLRLVFTGWFYWTDASVNMASARTPGIDFVPPLLQVPDGQGGWRETGPPLGFPAGKTKSMVIDVSDILSRSDPRLRLFSTLRLYWDRIQLAVDDDDAPLQVTSLEPASARLWRRGFSAPLASQRDDLPERFDFEQLTEGARWNQHPGLYTRLGECLPLVQQIDDQFVILGSGDALELQFAARELPPLAEGLVRDYLVFLDGWAKDRDPNTIDALEVEPLPFHAMSGYPYRADEHFPDSPAHRVWREEWNTRPAYEQVVPISPRREVEWLLGTSRP